MHPIIGITGDALAEPSAVLNLNQADYAPRMIKQAIAKVGGVPVILPIVEGISEMQMMVETYIQMVDGVVIPGGQDIEPTLFGETPIPENGPVNLKRDRFEIALVKAAIAAQKPIFAVCRGLQVINVALGGSLYQDLVTQNPAVTIEHPQSLPGQIPTHEVQLKAQSRIAALTSGTELFVNSRHHQAVKALGAGLRVTGMAPDGVVEAIESVANDLILAVQWHPENLFEASPKELQLFADLVERAKRPAKQLAV